MARRSCRPCRGHCAILAAQPGTRELVVVLVTDGEVAGEDVVLKSLTHTGGRSMPRIHTLGIDRAVNAGFLRKLADLGGGTCDLVESEERLDEAMDHIHRAIGNPVLTQIRLEVVDGEWVAESLAPSRLPDLFADRPVTVFARHQCDPQRCVCGCAAWTQSGNPWEQEVAAQPGPADTLQSLWGRARVRDLEDQYASGNCGDPQVLADAIVAVSLESHVLCRFTAYVAVDRSAVVNAGGQQEHIIQPVELPDGWEAPGAAMGRLSPRMIMNTCSLQLDASYPMPSRSVSPSLYSVTPLTLRPPTIAELIVSIQRRLDEMDAHTSAKRSWYHRRIEELSDMLVMLLVLLQMRGAADPHVVPLEELREEIDSCMTADADRDAFMRGVERLRELSARLPDRAGERGHLARATPFARPVLGVGPRRPSGPTVRPTICGSHPS